MPINYNENRWSDLHCSDEFHLAFIISSLNYDEFAVELGCFEWTSMTAIRKSVNRMCMECAWNIYIYIYTRIFGPRFARPRFFAVRGLSLDVSPCFRIPFCGFTKALGNTLSVFSQRQSTAISRCCLYFADFRTLDPRSGGKRCTATSNDTAKVAQGSKNGHLLECFWNFVGLMANAIC